MGKRSKRDYVDRKFQVLVLAKNHFLDFSRGRRRPVMFIRIRCHPYERRKETAVVTFTVLSVACGFPEREREREKQDEVNRELTFRTRHCRNYPLGSEKEIRDSCVACDGIEYKLCIWSNSIAEGEL